MKAVLARQLYAWEFLATLRFDQQLAYYSWKFLLMQIFTSDLQNHTIYVHTGWAPAAELCCLWPLVGLVVWVYSANTVPPLLDNEHSSSKTG